MQRKGLCTFREERNSPWKKRDLLTLEEKGFIWRRKKKHLCKKRKSEDRGREKQNSDSLLWRQLRNEAQRKQRRAAPKASFNLTATKRRVMQGGKRSVFPYARMFPR